MKLSYRLNIFFLGLLLISINSFGQCKADECLSKITSGYTFLKTYQMENLEAQAEYSYVFSKETNYMLSVCNKNGNSDNIEVTFCDAQRKEIASNFDKKTGKFYPAIAYNCKATGIYYLKFSFKENAGCCVSVLSFKK